MKLTKFIYFLVIDFLTCFNFCQCSSTNQIWQPAVVSNDTLQNKTLQSKQVIAASDIVCSMIASRLPWAHLFCIQDDGVCKISSLLAVPYDTGPVTNPVNCMTNIDGCLLGSTNLRFKIGEFYCPPTAGPFVYQCTKGIMVQLTNPQPKATCPLPFTMRDEYGCILPGNATATWCEARKYCLTYGSDLVSFENATAQSYLKGFTTALGYNGEFWTGCYGNTTLLQWVTGLPINGSSKLWYNTNYPRYSFDRTCVLVTYTSYYNSYHMLDKSCDATTKKTFYCQIKIL